MLSPDTLLQARYRIVRRIGQGGMGAVYEATHEELGHTVALKETFHTDDETLRQAFRREARLLAGLSHPKLPRVTDYFTEGDGLYLVMEYVRGEDLAELLRRRGHAFHADAVLEWASQLLNTLDYLHTREPPVIHRDIKPSNIKVTEHGEVCLLDFGLAKGTTAATTIVSVRGGTLAYAPPEQLHQQGTDARSDLFSLAATLYHLLTGEIAPIAIARLAEIGAGRPDPLRPASELSPQIPTSVADLLTQALSLDRARRPSSAAEMSRLLRDASDRAATPTVVTAPTVVDGYQSPSPHDSKKSDATRPDSEDAHAASGGAWVLAREIATRNAVYRAMPSPDGEWLASIGGDETIKLWDMRTGDLRQKLTGHTNLLQSVAFSPDGGAAVSGAMDSTVRLWNVRTGELLRVLTGHRGYMVGVAAVAFSPDGRTVVSGGGDNSVKLWDAETGELIRTLEGHNRSVQTLAFSPGGELLASGSDDTTIKIWDVATGALLRTLLWHDESVRAVAFAPDGTLGSGSTDNTLRLWDAQTGDLLRTLEHEASVFSVAFAPNGRTVVGAGGQSKMSLWDARTGELRQELTEQGGAVWSVAFSRDGATLVSGGDSKSIKLWKFEAAPADAASESSPMSSAQTASPDEASAVVVPPPVVHSNIFDAASDGVEVSLEAAWEIEGHAEYINSVAFSPDGATLASGSDDRLVKLWDARTGELRETLIGHRALVRSCVFSPDGAMLASKAQDAKLRLWDTQTGELLHNFSSNSSIEVPMLFTHDGKTLVVADYSNLKLLDMQTGKLRHEFEKHEKSLSAFALSPDGEILASGGFDHTITLWEMKTGELLRTLTSDEHGLFSLAFSPDGATLASGGGDDYLVTLWDVRTGDQVRRLKGHEDRVRRLVFSPDGATLVSGSYDRTIKVWDLGRGKLRQMFVGYSGYEPPVLFLPDGATLASGGDFDYLSLWDARTGEKRQTFGQGGGLRTLSLSRDGRALAAAGYDKMIRLWRVVRHAS
jgi:WD40 repeat protein/predicted Ser/Thr protein kinase